MAKTPFNKGITVKSYSGIDFQTSATTRAQTYVNPGTGTVTIAVSRTLSTTNQNLLAADDVDIKGTLAISATRGRGPGFPNKMITLGARMVVGSTCPMLLWLPQGTQRIHRSVTLAVV